MNEVRCTNTESRLIDCPFSLNHECGHSEDAGVRCTSSTTGKKDDWYNIIVVVRHACGIKTVMC